MKKRKDKIKKGIQWFFTPPNVEEIDKEISEIKTQKKRIELYKNPLSTKNITMFWLIGLGFAFVGFYLFNFLNTLFIILAAYIISIIMEGIIHHFEKRKLSRALSITISYTIFVIVTLLCIIFISPLIIDQLSGLLNMLSNQVQYLQELFTTNSATQIIDQGSRIPSSIKTDLKELISTSNVNFDEVLKNSVTNILSQITSSIGVFGNIAVQTLDVISNFLIKLMMIIFLSILFSVEKYEVSTFITSLFPKHKQYKIKLQIQRMYKYLAFWFKYRLALSIFMFVAMYLCFWILYIFGIDISHKFSLSLSLAILDIIPYLGPIIAGVLMFFSAIVEHGFRVSILVPTLVLIVNTLENTVVVPYIMNKSMGVSLILTFVCMLLGGLVMGLLGVFLSIPFAMILTLFFQKESIIQNGKNKKIK